jgi:predicted RND superfamily exporter protein
VGIRDRIETGFERWARLVFRHARAALAVSLLAVAGLAAQLPRLELEVSDEAFLHETDPVRVAYDRFRRQFERDQIIAVAVRAPEIFDLGFLEKLRALQRDLERSVPQLQEVTSLVNARYTHGRGDELVVEDLLEHWPESEADLADLRARVMAQPLYRNLYISADGRVAALMIELDTYSSLGAGSEGLSGFDDAPAPGASVARPFLTGREAFAIVSALRAVIARHQAPDFELFVTGGPVVEATLMTAMQRDIALFVGLSVLMIVGCLYALFRRLSGVLLPLVVVVLALVCTVASMAATGVPVTLPIQVLPTFLLAVGVCDSIHLLALVYRALGRGVGREDAVARALSHSGLAISMTSLTTIVGLASFASAELAPVMHFGIFGPLGVFFAFAFTVVLLPALLALVPLRAAKASRGAARTAPPAAADRWDRWLQWCGATAVTRPGRVLAVSGACLAVALLGASRLRFSWEPLTWFPEDEPVRIATEVFDRDFGGSESFEMFLDAGDENGFQDPELLRRLEELRRFAASFERGGMKVGKTVSVADVLKEIHQALNENRPEYYAIPGDRKLVAQEFLLFENTGSDDLEDVVDTRFRLASFTFRTPNGDAMSGVPFLNEIEAHFRRALDGMAEVTMTGGLVMNGRSFYAMIHTMARSYALALLLVTPLMILMLGSLRGGLISMIPNVTPVILTLGLMGWLDVPIDFSTMMSGAVILGLAVDDTIHFAHNFQRFHARGSEPAEAVRRTLETTGRAMLFTSLVLGGGFLIYVFASMENLVNLGVFTAFAIATAFLADVLLAPALMVLVPPFRVGVRDAPAGAEEAL